MKQFHKVIKYSRELILLICMVSTLLHLNAQTQGITDSVHKQTGVEHGYYYSLPLDYATNPTKKYPLLIALHGNGEKGNGSSELYKVLQGGGTTIADRLNANTFPAYFEVDDETFSFIVVCPQYDGWNSKKLLQQLKASFRVDPERIYLTGLSEGGSKSWSAVAGFSNYHYGPDSFAAVFLVCPSINVDTAVIVGEEPINNVNRSNLPVFGAYNSGEPTASIKRRTDSLVNSLNITIPSVSPPARKIVYNASGHEGWTKSYDHANIIDSVGWTNMYKWFLKFRNKNLVAKAGKDAAITLPGSSVTLDGSKSTARRGRIASYLWSWVSGPGTYTIASPSSAVTNVSNLIAGTYQFELRLTHDTAGVTATDTITVIVNPDTSAVQTQTKITQNVSTNIKGYLLSLPVDYSNDTTKKFPLIISLHGADAVGDSSTGAPLDSVAANGIPRLIRDGQFPSSFNVDNKNYSFIVVSPQINSPTPSFIHNQLNTLLTHLKSTLRIDAERVYVAGLGIGGGFGYTFAIGGTTTTNVGFPDSIAAMVGAGSNVPSINATQRARLVQSNLPHWLTHNNADPVIASSKSSNAVSSYNSSIPTPSPLAKLTIFTASTQDSWTATYDPNYILDSAQDYNVYQWLLQYTNKRVAARAGQDVQIAVDSVILDGSNSTARNGRATYLWTQVQGTSATIVSDTSAVTKVSGLAAGVNKFELKLTHDSIFTGNIVRDTVTVTVSNSSPRIAAPVVNLVRQVETADELLRVSINPTVAQSQLTVLIAGKAKGKASLQLSGIDGRRIQRQSFVKDATVLNRIVNVTSLASGIYLIEVTVNGKYRKVLRFIKQ